MKFVFGTPVTDYLPALGLGVLTVVFLVTAYTYTPDARAFPVPVAWATLGLVALDLISRTKTPVGKKIMHLLNPAGEDEEREHFPARRQAIAMGWVVVFAALLVLVGVVPGVVIYIFSFMRFHGRMSLLVSVASAAGLALLLWAVFSVLLRIPLYPGIFFGGDI